MNNKEKIIRFIAVVGLSILFSLIFGGVFTTDISNCISEYDDFLKVSYIVKNLYVMFNIGIAIYAYFKIFRKH